MLFWGVTFSTHTFCQFEVCDKMHVCFKFSTEIFPVLPLFNGDVSQFVRCLKQSQSYLKWIISGDFVTIVIGIYLILVLERKNLWKWKHCFVLCFNLLQRSHGAVQFPARLYCRHLCWAQDWKNHIFQSLQQLKVSRVRVCVENGKLWVDI